MKLTFKYPSPVGPLYICAEGECITEITNRISKDMLFGGTTEGHKNAVDWLNIYFSGKCPDFTPAIKLDGSCFRKTVWKLLLEIPYGKTVTYGELAQKVSAIMNKRPCAQAVGGAVGANPVCIIVPCHRVIGAGNKLTGYAGGLGMKTGLLKLEGIDTESFK